MLLQLPAFRLQILRRAEAISNQAFGPGSSPQIPQDPEVELRPPHQPPPASGAG